MSAELVVWRTPVYEQKHDNPDDEEHKHDRISSAESAAILLGNNHPLNKHEVNANNHVRTKSNGHARTNSTATSNSHARTNSTARSNSPNGHARVNLGGHIRTNTNGHDGRPPPEAKQDYASAARQPLSLAEQWALELAQMPSAEQERIQQSLRPKRTKAQEEQREKDRAAAGVSPFRRLSFDFVPLEGDETPRFEERKHKIENEENDVFVVSEEGGGHCKDKVKKKKKLEQEKAKQRYLCEQLGELTKEEKLQLEETKSFLHFEFYRNYIQIVSMFKPVLFICGIIFAYVHIIRIPWENKYSLIIWDILFYNPKPSDSLSVEVVGSLYNGLLVLAFVVGATMMYVVLLLLNARESLLRVLQVLNMALLAGPSGYFLYQLLVLYSIRLDAVSFVGCIWNVVGVGWFALNYNGNSKTYLTRSFLILLAVCMAWPFIEFPEPSVWATLGLLVVYDLFAVLAPCGPLRYIMEAEAKLKREGRAPKPLPGLVYRGHFFIVGLGDLVFYGALMGQASVPGWETALGCLIGILMGVAGTVLWTTSSGKLATPALPMSAVLGLFLRLVVPAFVLPMFRALSLHSLMV